jgi:hypothetical protein
MGHNWGTVSRRWCSAWDDRNAFAGGCGETFHIAAIAGEYPVTIGGYEHDRGINRITRPGPGYENAGFATDLLIDRTYIYRTKKSGQFRLAATWIAPYLRDDHRVSPQIDAVTLSNPKPGNHGTIITIHS